MTRFWIQCLVTVSLFVCGRVARSEESAPPAEPPAALEPAPAVKPVTYAVWTSGGCSRSLREAATFTDVREACEKAEALRKDHAYVMVIAGGSDWGSGYEVFRWLRGIKEPPACEKCSLYVFKTCRAPGWREQDLEKATDVKAAEGRAAELRKENRRAVLVYHFAESP